MADNNFPTALPQASAPFIEVSTGNLTLTGYRFVSALWNRTGGNAGSNSASTLQSANNLSDLTSATSARSNLGLGSAATASASSFATASQGTDAETALGLAETALQPNTTISVTGVQISGKQVLGPQIAGWGTPTGGSRSSGASYAGQTIGATYSQAQAQSTDNAVKLVSQQLMQLIADLKAQGMLGT